MTPAPAHGDGPTRPSAPTGRTGPRGCPFGFRHYNCDCKPLEATTPEPADPLSGDLRERLRDAIRESQRGLLGTDRPVATGNAVLAAVLPVVEAETAALRQRIEEVEDQRDQALAWQDTAERELRNAERRLDAAERIAAALEAERDKARDAIADERRGRLTAEAAVRRAREVSRNRIAVPADVLLDALTIEQPKENP